MQRVAATGRSLAGLLQTASAPAGLRHCGGLAKGAVPLGSHALCRPDHAHLLEAQGVWGMCESKAHPIVPAHTPTRTCPGCRCTGMCRHVPHVHVSPLHMQPPPPQAHKGPGPSESGTRPGPCWFPAASQCGLCPHVLDNTRLCCQQLRRHRFRGYTVLGGQRHPRRGAGGHRAGAHATRVNHEAHATCNQQGTRPAHGDPRSGGAYVVDGRDNAWRSRAPGPHAHENTARQVMDGLRTEVWGKQRPPQQPAQPQYANYWAPLTRKRHILPHPAQPRPTNHWAPRTRKRHQQEAGLTESSDPTQHAKGRIGDCPGPRKETATRRNVIQGGGVGGGGVQAKIVEGNDALRDGAGAHLVSPSISTSQEQEALHQTTVH